MVAVVRWLMILAAIALGICAIPVWLVYAAHVVVSNAMGRKRRE